MRAKFEFLKAVQIFYYCFVENCQLSNCRFNSKFLVTFYKGCSFEETVNFCFHPLNTMSVPCLTLVRV